MENVTKTEIERFLAEHSAIKVAAFLKECGLGRNYLTQLETETIPPATSEKILRVMVKYGYKPGE